MISDTTDLTRLLYQALAGLILIAGTVIDLYCGMLYQTRRLTPSLAARALLDRRPFTAFHAQLTLFATILFALPMISQTPAIAVPGEYVLILSPLFYALAGFAVVTLCLTYSRATPRQAFLSPRCSARKALGKGVLYGLALIPPVVLLSLLITSAAESLGFELHLQEVFDWLGDDSLSRDTRLFMMTSAVLIAPVVEETLFRGIIFTAALKTRSFLSAALLSGAYFALVHFHALSFLPLLALSLAFSAGYAATGSILTPIAMHALFNLSSLLLYLAENG